MKNTYKKIYKIDETVHDSINKNLCAFAKGRLCLIKSRYSFLNQPTSLTGCGRRWTSRQETTGHLILLI